MLSLLQGRNTGFVLNGVRQNRTDYHPTFVIRSETIEFVDDITI